MILTLDSGQVLELIRIDTNRFVTTEEHQPQIPELYELNTSAMYGAPVPRLSQVTYPAIRIGNQFYGYKLKQ